MLCAEKPKLTAEEALWLKAPRDRSRQYNVKQQAETALHFSTVKNYEERAAFLCTAVSSEQNRGDKSDRAGSGGGGS